MSWSRDPRSWGLLFCAGVCVSRTLAYLPGDESLPHGLGQVADLLPTWVYAILWGATAAQLALIAVTQESRRPRHAFIVGVPFGWGLLYFVGSVFDRTDEGALTAAILFWFMAGIFASLVMVAPTRRDR